jgi:L-alanine-DL-glutamate epimerase-like enolase superfamily enzyme
MPSQMQIARLVCIPIELPVRPDVVITSSLGTHAVSRYLLVRVETDAGLSGIGEATVTPVWSGETAVGARHLIEEYLAPALIGRDPTDVAGALAVMDRAAFGNPFTKAAVEMGLLDLWGQRERRPVFDLLGGAVTLPSGGTRPLALPIRFSLAAGTPEATAALAAQRVREGFRTIKVKVGTDPAADVARVRAVREAIGPEVGLTVDANGGWSAEDAIRAVREMAPLDLRLVEQPTPRDDLAAMARVRRAIEVPIMADESVFTIADAREVVRREAADVISIYPGKNGGILRCRQIAEMAVDAGIACAIGSNLELDVATAAMCHLAVATPNVAADRFPGDLLGPLYYAASVVEHPIQYCGGTVHCPEGPGLGVSLRAEWSGG